MKRLIRKFKSKRGETFVEILLAIVIVGFGCMLIATLFGTSFTLNLEAQKKDDAFYQAITEMEERGDDDISGSDFRVQITDEENKSIDVGTNRYGDDAFSSYRRN